MNRRSDPPAPQRPLFTPSGKEGQAVTGVYSVERITYQNPETGYAVVRLVPVEPPSALGVIAVGVFGDLREGECYRIQGAWRTDPRYGLQVKVDAALRELPRSRAAIERYLSGATIKGLGPTYAARLVSHFGEETFSELQAGGSRLEEVPGIGPVRAQMIRESWAEHQGIHDLMVNLQGVAQLTPSQAGRVYRQYGQRAWEVLRADPYILAEEVRGFGFKTCDRIGQALGIAHDAPQRIQAACVYLLNRALEEGHLWTARAELLSQAQELLGLEPPAIAPEVNALVAAQRVALGAGAGAEEPQLYLPQVALAEEHIAARLRWFLALPPAEGLGLSPERAGALVQQLGSASLTDEQRLAIAELLQGQRLVVLTGGPGTGKTTTVRTLLACLEARHVPYALCATTGRASKQLAAATGRQAATVHRHLGLGGAGRVVEPVRERVLIIDESSMIDLWLLDQITARLTDKTHLFLVGDVDQLPSVGPGAALQDLIAAREEAQVKGLHVARLTRIFRQEAGNRSMIVINCHRVRRGERPLADVPKDSDYFEMLRDTPELSRELAVSLATERLPRYLQVEPNEVQVLAPMHSGEAGIRALNRDLQATLNPPAAGKLEITHGEGGLPLRVGDKMRQTRNDYQKQVFNGDLGLVTALDPETRSVTVTFDDVVATYASDELDDLTHSWAMTVHAAQGSQWPAVVIIMLTSHYVMLERNILYTALSRAQRMAVLITQEQAVRLAVAQDRATRRRTGLVRRLAEG